MTSHAPGTTSTSRRAVPKKPAETDEDSTHFHVRPATRPANLPEPDPATFSAMGAIGDQAGRKLKARLRRQGITPHTATPIQAAATLAAFGLDLSLILGEHTDVADVIGTGQTADTVHAWNHWMDGDLGDGPALIDLSWRLGLHPCTIGALELLVARIYD